MSLLSTDTLLLPASSVLMVTMSAGSTGWVSYKASKISALPLCNKMPYQSKNCVIHGHKFTNNYHDNNAFDFSHWDNDDNSIVYFIPTIKDENELNIFVITPYPPPLIGRYDYSPMPDEEYDLMINKLRNQILKASPHVQI
jgi:hypothetical protein